MGILNSIKGWFGSAQAKAAELTEDAKELASNVSEKAAEVIEAGKSKAAELTEDAKEMASNASEKVKDMISGNEEASKEA